MTGFDLLLWISLALPIVGAVVFKGTSDFSAVIKDQDKLIQQNIKLKQQLKEVTDESKKQDAGFKGALTTGLSQVKSMVGGYLSMQGAIALVNKGLEEQNRLSREAHQVQMTVADSEKALIRMLGSTSTSEVQTLIATTRQIASDAGLASSKELNLAQANIISATGDVQLSSKIAKSVAPIFTDKPAEMVEFAGAVGDALGKIPGDKTQADVDRVVSLLLSTTTQARITDLSQLAPMVQGASGIMAVDRRPDRIAALEEAMELMAAGTQGLTDADASITRTGMINFAVKIDELLQKHGHKVDSIDDKVSIIRSDDKLMDKAQKLSFGKGFVNVVMRQFLADPEQSTVAMRLPGTRAEVSSDPKMREQLLKNLGTATPELVLATATRGLASAQENYDLTPGLGNAFLARDAVNRSYERTRGNPIRYVADNIGAMLGRELMIDDPEEAIGRLQGREKLVRQRGGLAAELLLGEGPIRNLLGSKSDSELTEKESAQVKFIQEQIAELRQLNATMKEIKEQPGPIPLNANREGR